MINPSFSELENISKSRYEICTMVSKRARMLVAGEKVLTKTKASKPVTKALQEIMDKKVWKEDEE